MTGSDDISPELRERLERARMKQEAEEYVAKQTRGWSSGAMILFVVGTLLIPLFGFVPGIIGLLGKQTKGQGLLLIVITLFWWVFLPFLYLLF